MSVEVEGTSSQDSKAVNGDGRGFSENGVSNGHSAEGSGSGGGSSDRHKSHKSSSKDKHRDKDRERDKDKHRSSDKDRDREKDKHRSSDRDKDRSDKHKSSSSSSSKDKDRDKEKSSSSSSKDKERDRHGSSHKSSKSDKDRDREKDKERSKDKDREKDKDRSKDKDKDRSKEKDRDKDKDRSKDKDREKDKDRKDRDKEKSSGSSKDKDRDKHKSSSSSRDKERDKDKHKSSSSSKHSSSSSSKDKDKHRDKERERSDKHSSSSSKDKDREKKDKIKLESDIKPEQEIKLGIFDDKPVTNGTENSQEPTHYNEEIKKEEETFDVSQASSCDYSMSQFRPDETPFVIKEEALDPLANSACDDEDGEEEPQEQSTISAPVKQESDSEDDVPLSKRKKKDDDDDFDGSHKKKKIKTEKKDKKEKKKKKRAAEEDLDDDDEEDYGAAKKKIKKEKNKVVAKTKVKTEVKKEVSSPTKGGRKKKEEEQQEVWKWWEEEKREDGVKWNTLEHKGPVFAPPYDPLPDNIKFEYDGKVMKLSQDAEEIAGFYAKMLEHDYTGKDAFNDNFFKDWRKSMTQKERETIKDLSKCNFRYMHKYFAEISEANRNRTKEEKAALKEKNEEMVKEYGFCIIDGHKEKIGNFRIEPPGLFRGRGEHPKMGLVKRRVMPEDVIINCGKESVFPQAPEGHRWKEVRHDNSVSWLASWTENVQGQVKYVMLNPSSKLKGEKDWQKYETARRLLKHIDKIRNTYREEWKSKEMRIRQRAVALYFIDKLALRAGNEKDEDQADTVGCCSLRVEHIELHKELNGKENVVVFDFLGKDSIRYYNEVEVEKRVFKNLELFKENKKDGDDLFDRLNTTVMNEHLRELMEGLTAKVFRTFNASFTLQNQLAELTDPEMTVPEKLLAYNRANRAVAILCNHQRAVPKSHDKSMQNLKDKIEAKRDAVNECQKELKDLKKVSRDKAAHEKKSKQLERLKEQLKKLELQETDRDENKTIALGTSKLNYLDPRISVAWCKKFDVPIEKIFNKTQREKFRWAIDMAGEDYVF
ncbi:DNA topoisomerase I, mitochondrial-like isoform X1 [Uranotaenia lowii]|uniref:DNA topoisomerase I, mitochondrial-like isoform X1 n=1 Tax=Uranotaenia lowii TaxID=190385 RepID=UPI00247ADC46|nr:DNA topoisomerase I, mitochondrial-like isoform X1 [Uranotaenia lowii]